MLHRAPHLGTRGAQVFGNASPADDHGSVVAQQAHDAAETRVSGVVAVRVNTSWWNSRDKTIMRESGEIG